MTPLERRIKRETGLTPAGLKVLAKAAASVGGCAYGDGFGHGAAGARQKLTADGLIDAAKGCITDAGRAVLTHAHRLGW